MTDILLDLLIVVLLIGFVLFIINEAKNNKKRIEKYIEESNICIEFFKNNNRLTDEIENLWTAIAFDKFPIYMNEEVGRKVTEFNEEERRKKGDIENDLEL